MDDDLKCPCGANSGIYNLDYRVFTFAGKVINLCTPCYEKVRNHSNEIYRITGDKYISLSNLINRSEP